MRKWIVLAAAGAVFYAGHGAVTGAVPSSAALHGRAAGNEALANRMAAAMYGWAGRQAVCLDLLWREESAGTWSPEVTNPYSGAYGIPQALPGSKMADPAQGGGPDWRTNPATQIRWGLGYIKGRYGDPCHAWAFETSHTPNWY